MDEFSCGRRTQTWVNEKMPAARSDKEVKAKGFRRSIQGEGEEDPRQEARKHAEIKADIRKGATTARKGATGEKGGVMVRKDRDELPKLRGVRTLKPRERSP